MADEPENPARADENGPAALELPERPPDVDVRSSAGPYPRPLRRGARKIWLAAAAAAVVLGLTWLLFQEDPLPPAPPVSAAKAEPEPAPAEEVVNFAPVPGQPEDQPEDRPAPAAVIPADRPTAVPAKPAAKPAERPAPAKPAQKVSPPAKPADESPPTPAPAPAKPAADPEKPEAVEISDRWAVNIYSTPDAAESLRFLSTLLGEDAGGRVYAYEASLEGRLQYRIRVGFFDTREEAEAVGLKIKERYNLYSTPWAVRPSREEEKKFGGR